MGNEDGVIVIGTKIDTKNLEKDLKRLQKEQLNLANAKAKIELDLTDYEKRKALIEETTNKELEMAQQQEQVDFIVEREQMELQKLTEEYSSQLQELNSINAKLQVNEQSIKNIRNQLTGRGIKGGLESILKSVKKIGLAFLGIRTAYSFIRQMLSQATQQNEELANKLDYIKYSLGSAFQPIAKVIINLIYNIVGGLGAIIKLITGINIFANATAENFNKANKNAGKLKKTLAGFDEANVLGENAGGSLASGIIPDLMKDTEDFAQKIKKWFLGGDTFKEGINNAVKYLKESFLPIANWFKLNIITPIKKGFIVMIDGLKPIWQPLYTEAKKVVNEQLKPLWSDFFENHLKPLWGNVSDYTRDNIVNPIKKQLAPFFNQIIDWINNTFGIFGVHIDRIETETEDTVKGTSDFVISQINDIKNKALELSGQDYKINITTNELNNAENSISNLASSLINVTSKTWKIATQFSSTLDSKSTPSILEGIRGALAKVGIKLPKLAQGGIINQPGRGVMYGGANIAERGAEGVIPLTDSQQMALLGEAIGKYITINATIPVYAYNRQVDKQIQIIKAEDDFASNR